MSELVRFISGNETVIPVSDSDFFTPDMSYQYQSCDFFIRFYSDADGTPVAPGAITSGDIEFEASPDEPDSGPFRYRTVQSGKFSATLVDDPDRVIPVALGTVTSAKLNLSGITGATHFRAWVIRR